MTLQDVLIIRKQYGDARADWGKTRDERTRAATFLAIFEEALEERSYCKVQESDRCENKEGDQGKCYNASTPGEKVLYDDEPRNMKELLAHPDKVLNANMLFKRKYEIVDGVERFKKWKRRLAVVGTGEIPGVDSSFSSFSPTVAFSAVRMLVALTVDPRFSVES